MGMGDGEVVENVESVSQPVSDVQPEGQRVVYVDDEPNRKGLWLWVGLVGFLLVLFIGVLFIFDGDSVVEISKEEFMSGKSVTFSENSKILIDMGDGEVQIDMTFSGNFVEVSYEGFEDIQRMVVGERRSLDLDNDGNLDLDLNIDAAGDEKVILSFEKYIEEEFGVEMRDIEDAVEVDTVVANGLTDEGDTEEIDDAKSIEDVVETCSDLGGYICDTNESCGGVLESDASDSDFCCNIMCSPNNENITAEQVCSDNGGYLYLEGYYCGGVLAEYYTEDVPVSCCSVEISEIVSPESQSNFINDFYNCEDNGNMLEYEGAGALFPVGDKIEFTIVEVGVFGCKVKTTLTESESSQFEGHFHDCDFDNTVPEYYSSEDVLKGYFIFGAQDCIGNLGEYIDFLAIN